MLDKEFEEFKQNLGEEGESMTDEELLSLYDKTKLLVGMVLDQYEEKKFGKTLLDMSSIT
jgi:hypothetical protein